MEKGRGVLFDASAYILLEASGDSDQIKHFDSALAAEEYPDSAAAEDDAQSCSYGSESDCARDDPDNSPDSDFDDYYRLEKEEEGENGAISSDEEEGVVDQCRRRVGGKAASADSLVSVANEKMKKSKGCEESSNVKVMNEREEDRLFWEACLAS